MDEMRGCYGGTRCVDGVILDDEHLQSTGDPTLITALSQEGPNGELCRTLKRRSK